MTQIFIKITMTLQSWHNCLPSRLVLLTAARGACGGWRRGSSSCATSPITRKYKLNLVYNFNFEYMTNLILKNGCHLT